MTSLPVELLTLRLHLRALAPDDADALTAAIDDWDVIRWLARVPYPYGKADAERWIALSRRDWQQGLASNFGVFHAGALIGGCGLTHVGTELAVLGYWLARARWGQGFGREMVSALCGWGLDPDQGDFERIEAGIAADNRRSEQLLRACGFQPLGDQVYLHPPRDDRVSGPHFCLTRDDLAARQAGSAPS